MPEYISEFQYYGDTSQEFIEVALPAGTDPSGYLVHVYMNDGSIYKSFPLGPSTGTMGGHDVYVINSSTPGFDDGGADPTGNLYPDDALALVDGDGNVQQFISYWGNTVTATEGPANGMTSTDVGTASTSQSLQSDDGGSNYYAQSSTNSGSIPACYASGSLIASPNGAVPIENIIAGDSIIVANGGTCSVRWIWSGQVHLLDVDHDQKPVLIRAGSLGRDRPSQDLVVSGQHRIVVGGFGQLEDAFDRPFMVPAKALTVLPGIRFMAGKKSITWHHLMCDEHHVIFANNMASESLLTGSEFIRSLSNLDLSHMSRATGQSVAQLVTTTTTLPCLTVGETRRRLKAHHCRSSAAPLHSRNCDQSIPA